MKKKKAPLESIRDKCIDCSGGEYKAVRECTHRDCDIYPLRMGRGSRSVLGDIKAYCRDCCKGQRAEVRQCPSEDCSLWPYRFGKRPRTTPPLPEISPTEGVLETIDMGKGGKVGVETANFENGLSRPIKEKKPVWLLKSRVCLTLLIEDSLQGLVPELCS